MSKDELLASLLGLAPEERQMVIHEAMDSLPDEFSVDLLMTPELRALIDARIRNMGDNPGDDLTLDEALAEIDRRREQRGRNISR